MKGLFITFEGNDGAGKSTQIRFLAEYLRTRGLDVLTTREPGGCNISEKIREILLDVSNADMVAQTEALLYAAARAQHVAEVIVPALKDGKIVICDRFIHSSLAYQGYGRNLGYDRIMDINRFACGGCMPDKTFFLQITADAAFKRMNENKVHDRLESEGDSFHDAVHYGFLDIIKKHGENIIVIDASGQKMETHEKIKVEIDKILLDAGMV